MNTPSCHIGTQSIGVEHLPFVIAELSGNHNQSLDRALAIVDAAADAGAQAIKLQTYTADTLTINHRGGLFDITDPQSLWAGKNLYALYQEAHTPWDWHAPIFARARERGLVVFSTPFDDTAVDLLESLDAPVYKIASFENTHLPLLRRVAQTGKPVIMSTGVATLAEITEAVATLRDHGCTELMLLKCTSNYPADPRDSNLRTIPALQELFQCPVGLSDHTPGMGAALASIALGASIIEKHLTLARADGGVDAAFSLEPAELAALVTESARAWQALGTVQCEPTTSEIASRRFKRSIYVTRPIAAGERLTTDNIRVIRPGDGLAPKHWDSVLGATAARDLPFGTPLQWNDVCVPS